MSTCLRAYVYIYIVVSAPKVDKACECIHDFCVPVCISWCMFLACKKSRDKSRRIHSKRFEDFHMYEDTHTHTFTLTYLTSVLHVRRFLTNISQTETQIQVPSAFTTCGVEPFTYGGKTYAALASGCKLLEDDVVPYNGTCRSSSLSPVCDMHNIYTYI